MTPLPFEQPPCCARQAITTMDYTKGWKGQRQEARIHRMCLTCYAHWFGPPWKVKHFTRAEWDAWIAEAGIT